MPYMKARRRASTIPQAAYQNARNSAKLELHTVEVVDLVQAESKPRRLSKTKLQSHVPPA